MVIKSINLELNTIHLSEYSVPWVDNFVERDADHFIFPHSPTDSEADQLRKLEDEQEQLNSSLLALTTHFAQVQFRLKQIVAAPPEEKEVGGRIGIIVSMG